MKHKIKHAKELVRNEYLSGQVVSRYVSQVRDIGLWESEKLVYWKYLKMSDRILDLGCGAGRTTINLYQAGFHDIEGVDASEAMIRAAKRNARELALPVNFIHGDAVQLHYDHATFDSVIFSFNGIMQIPWSMNRKRACSEIRRVLKQGGFFIFTTHDRHYVADYADFWAEQKNLWREGRQDPRLLEYGDIIVEDGTNPLTFAHIPTPEEVRSLLDEVGFCVEETAMRSELLEEPEHIKKYSTDCRFWIVR